MRCRLELNMHKSAITTYLCHHGLYSSQALYFANIKATSTFFARGGVCIVTCKMMLFPYTKRTVDFSGGCTNFVQRIFHVKAFYVMHGCLKLTRRIADDALCAVWIKFHPRFRNGWRDRPNRTVYCNLQSSAWTISSSSDRYFKRMLTVSALWQLTLFLTKH